MRAGPLRVTAIVGAGIFHVIAVALLGPWFAFVLGHILSGDLFNYEVSAWVLIGGIYLPLVVFPITGVLALGTACLQAVTAQQTESPLASTLFWSMIFGLYGLSVGLGSEEFKALIAYGFSGLLVGAGIGFVLDNFWWKISSPDRPIRDDQGTADTA